MAEAVSTLTSEVIAGRRNVEAFPGLPADVFARMCEPPPRLYPVGDEQFSMRVRKDGAA